MKSPSRYLKNKIYIVGNMVCQKRGLDADRLLRYFESNGWESTNDPANAQLILLVTCAFTEPFVNSAVDLIKEVRNMDSRVFIYGCLPDMAPKRFEEVYVENWLAPKDIEDIDRFFPEFEVSIKEVPASTNMYLPAIEGRPAHQKNMDSLRSNKKAMILVNEGCAGSCTYCAHPKALGKLKSKPLEKCREEYLELIKDADKINIHGNDPGAWGMEIGSTLPALLSELEGIEDGKKIEWVLTDIGPRWLLKFKDTFIHYAGEGKIAYLGIPVQSASPKILKLMNRPVDTEELIETLQILKSKSSDMQLATHLIVGFPGETEEDYGYTYSLLEKNIFNSVMVFRYSDTEVSKSSDFENKVSQEVIEERTARIRELVESQSNKLTIFT